MERERHEHLRERYDVADETGIDYYRITALSMMIGSRAKLRFIVGATHSLPAAVVHTRNKI